MERNSTLNGHEQTKKRTSGIDKKLEESIVPIKKHYSYKNIKRYDEYVNHLDTSKKCTESKKIEHIIDKLDDEEIEKELPVSNGYSDAEVGSVLKKELIDDETLEIMKRIGQRGVIYTEISKYYWQVRGENLVRIA